MCARLGCLIDMISGPTQSLGVASELAGQAVRHTIQRLGKSLDVLRAAAPRTLRLRG